MSNFHKDLDEANKHEPKGWTAAVVNTFPIRNENNESTYEENFTLPRAINFVDGTVAAPTNADGDIYVLTGSGTLDASWGTLAAFGDWVRAKSSAFVPITPETGTLCYDDTASSWKEFDGSVWAAFGGGGGAVDTIFTGGTMTAHSTITMGGNNLTFGGGATYFQGADTLLTTQGFMVWNSASKRLLDIKNDGTTEINEFLTIDDQIFQTSRVEMSNSVTGGRGLYTFDMGGISIGSVGAYGTAYGALPLLTGKLVYTSNSGSNGHVFGTGNATADYKFALNGLTDSDVDLKLNTTGLLVGSGIGATSINAKLHVKGVNTLSTGVALLVQGSTGVDSFDVRNNGTLRAPNLQVYADDTAAGVGGLLLGDIYQTATGELRIKL